MSKETLEYHHDKHHKAYVDNGNKLASEAGIDASNANLEEVVKQSFGKNAVSSTMPPSITIISTSGSG
jgi:Fe-Mn family superoxide dismutase